MINFDIILVFAVIVFILISLYKGLFGSSFTFLLAVIILGIFGIITPAEILSGLANVQVAVIIMLLLYGDILRKTDVIENLFDKIFRRAKSQKRFLGRMMMIVSVSSAFLNNTPLVAATMPYVHNWCKRNAISPSKFLIPLSFATILGGQITLIGTSTNLIVNGMVEQQNMESIKMFEFAWVGIPMTILGLLYLYFFSNKLLPSNSPIVERFNNSSREYVVEAKVRNDSFLIGKSVNESGLMNLKGLFLVEILRKTLSLTVDSPDIILEKGDILVFAGQTDKITDLINANTGLVMPEIGVLSKMKKSEVVEVIVSQNSSLINKTIRDVNFRGKYDAAIIAVHRNGERIEDKLGDLVLKAGDVLLCFTGESFNSRTSVTQDFYFISKVRDLIKLDWYKVTILFGGLLLIIILSSFKIIPLFTGLIVLIVTSLILKVTHPKELPLSVDYNLALIIVLSLALGTAMIKSGAASLIADNLITIFMPLGQFGILFGIYLITTLLATFITNKASVAVMFPIALETSQILKLNPMPFILLVAFASAANFITPIGYQTNLMVYGPGGYSYKDFLKIGVPITILYMFVAVTILYFVYLY